MMSQPKVLLEAQFDRKVCLYWLLSGTIIMVVCIVTIPFIPIWLAIGMMVTGRYLDHMSCTLTPKNLIVKKGWLNRIEKTIPLEKITDLALKQGPIMRAMNLEALSVETAGSSSGPGGALVSMTGIINTMEFRDRVLAHRDVMNERTESKSTEMQTSTATGEGDRVIHEIRDTLQRIERLLESKNT
jgi:putative membrane protein